MVEFKVGDTVEIGIKRKEFIDKAHENSSTYGYIMHLAEGNFAEIVSVDTDSVRLKADVFESQSNWFKTEWLRVVDKNLIQIKKESQRL